MIRKKRSLLAAGVAVAVMAAAPVGATAAEKPGSVFVQCDGLPAGDSIGDLLGAIVVITMTAGLAGSSEQADSDKILKGDAGAQACDTAAVGETLEERRAQLRLAKAVHRIEANRFDEAIADARSLAEVAPKKAVEPGFKRGLALSAMEIEGYALVRQGKMAEAQAMGLRMYDASPYDLMNLLRASRLVLMSPDRSPATDRFWDEASRLLPDLLGGARLEADEWAGDFAGAAADLQAFVDLTDGFLKDKDDHYFPDSHARIALSHMLAGNTAASEAAAEAARKAIDANVQANKRANQTSKGQELLDLQAIAKLHAEGKLVEARRAFGARSRWLAPSVPVSAELTRRLREGAAPSELVGALALDPAKIRTDGQAARVRGFVEEKTFGRYLLNGRRMAGNEETAGSGLSKRVWNVTKSPYRQKASARDMFNGTTLYAFDVTDIAMTSRAFALHAALVAKADGKSRFVFMPATRKGDTAIVRFGAPGDVGMPERGSNDVEKVISTLSPLIPQPPPKT